MRALIAYVEEIQLKDVIWGIRMKRPRKKESNFLCLPGMNGNSFRDEMKLTVVDESAKKSLILFAHLLGFAIQKMFQLMWNFLCFIHRTHLSSINKFLVYFISA